MGARGFLIFFVGLSPHISHTLTGDFRTARLMSTGGAGAASLAVDEATVLNPAPLAFFEVASVYFQRSEGTLSDGGAGGPRRPGAGGTAVIASDTKGALKGSASYVRRDGAGRRRRRLAAALAGAVGERSSMGLSWRRTADDGPAGARSVREQASLGVLHVVSPELSLGVVFVDPLGEVEADRRGIAGVQYVHRGFISLMADVGADYASDMGGTFVHREAVQIKLLGDLYGRFGLFDDRGAGRRGTGAGLSWVGPRLVLDLAHADSGWRGGAAAAPQPPDDGERERETSFAVSYRF